MREGATVDVTCELAKVAEGQVTCLELMLETLMVAPDAGVS